MIERRQGYMVLSTAMMMAAIVGEVPVDEALSTLNIKLIAPGSSY